MHESHAVCDWAYASVDGPWFGRGKRRRGPWSAFPQATGLSRGVSDGTRTRGILDHNQVLYQLSYTHHDRR